MNPATTTLERRQIWANPTPASTALPHSCSPFLLPSGGTLNLGGSNIVTLGFDAVFQPFCPSHTATTTIDPLQTDLSVLDHQDPFYTSTNPLIYAISATTIVSYMLVIILFATPRTFYVGGVGGGVSLLGRRGGMGGSYASNTVIGIGSRPWLQKIAALTLAISMTIVTADALKYAERQYRAGYEDAEELTRRIIDGLEIKIVRLISESFLWLAQAQTLIRLFQRHREKVVIKWTAFVLISLEVIFTILHQFVHENTPHQPRAFANSIPALNYLFALALNICYAAFVIVWTLRKRRFAFFHPQMHSMPLIAFLSLCAVLIPVIFFILDLSKPDVSGWGSYVRWVGACAASVVVWEWVERIEALEREEKKDGILGREVFDGDEMFENSGSKPYVPKSPRDGGGGGLPTRLFGNTVGAQLNRLLPAKRQKRKSKADGPIPLKHVDTSSGDSSVQDATATDMHPGINVPTNRRSGPPVVGSPVSRTDSSSAASTVYAVRYHPMTEPTPPIPENSEVGNSNPQQGDNEQQPHPNRTEARTPPKALANPSRFARIPIPFRRQRQSPPAEVAAALADQQIQPSSSPKPTPPPPSLLDRLHLRRHQPPAPMPKGVIFVPAPPRRRHSRSQSLHEQDSEPESDNESEGEGGDERPPAVVRNAIRRSTPATPATEHEHEHFMSIDVAAQDSPVEPSVPGPADHVDQAQDGRWEPVATGPGPGNEDLVGPAQAPPLLDPSAPHIEDLDGEGQATPLAPSAPPMQALDGEVSAASPEPSTVRATNHDR